MRNISSLLTLTSLLLAFNICAQDKEMPCDKSAREVIAANTTEEVQHIRSFVPAKPIDRVDPRYPTSAARVGAEGWVRMSYVIDEEGNVVNPVIEDSGGSRSFRRNALNALKKWTFEPAMKDGEPTKQCHQSVQIDFAMVQKGGASRRFVSKYKAIDALLEAGDLQQAQEAMEELHERDANNRYENPWLWSLDARLASELEEYRRELASWSRAISSSRTHSPEHKTFADNFVAKMYARQYQLNAYYGQYAKALEAASNLESMEGQSDVYEGIADSVNSIREFIASDETIRVSMELKDRSTQFYNLTRNRFMFEDIQGHLDTVEIRCDSHYETYTVAEEHLWTIPESWGACRVMIKGDMGTQYNILEVAQATTTDLNS